MTSVAALYILNRNGSLICEQDRMGVLQLSSNDKIRLTSTFHGISAIAAKISPVQRSSGGSFGFLQPSGIQVLDADTFRLQCYHTATGMKFMAMVLPPIQDVEPLLKQVYILYSDFALKNPFYELDMPVRCELFDREVQKLVAEIGFAAPK